MFTPFLNFCMVYMYGGHIGENGKYFDCMVCIHLDGELEMLDNKALDWQLKLSPTTLVNNNKLMFHVDLGIMQVTTYHSMNSHLAVNYDR